MTPDEELRNAVQSGDHEAVKALLDGRVANVNARDPVDQSTPLHDAATEGHARIAELLLQRGAVVDAEDCHGDTPAVNALWAGHEDLAEFLEQAQLQHGHTESLSRPKTTHAEDAADRKSERGPRQPGD
jgi:ankyrin repeat protein